MTQEEALAWLANMFNEPSGKLRADAKKDDVTGWDSLAVLLLMADLDEKFGIQLAEKEMEGMQSIRDILSVLERHGKLAG
jgi:acyl carrier protein